MGQQPVCWEREGAYVPAKWPQPQRLSQVCQVCQGHPLSQPPPPQEPKSAHCQQSLVEETKGFQILWLLPGCIKQNKVDLPLSLLKSNQLWMSHLTSVSIIWVPQM